MRWANSGTHVFFADDEELARLDTAGNEFTGSIACRLATTKDYILVVLLGHVAHFWLLEMRK